MASWCDAVQTDHLRAMEATKGNTAAFHRLVTHQSLLFAEEHKRELDRLKSNYEDSIVDLTVQNYGNQQSGNDTLKQKILLLKEEIKSYVWHEEAYRGN